ncbi:MAG TPA: tRNA1(Val) (adenine(37)-N6)-methyltransferase [Clostridia bacterium]|nr:tRNA1(Val) (adenine(37)-N6)-methyltransferase [Clostridia bacterium]HQM96141.1 tRNA1(Val) (adenine(37)-N6)-methyltransferase [Clostridia bacterium]HQO69068.1 tRNA1(Val) (adenine(37)-N6)-methyltransferase [Clostridia bacterium]
MHMIYEDERLDDLQLDGLKIIQNKKQFCFGTDAVLLSSFSNVRGTSTVIDLGTGNGIIPLLLYGKYKPKQIIGIEIQKDIYELAVRNVKLNNLEERISIINGDVRNIKEYFQAGSFDQVVTNPPYLKAGTGIISAADAMAYARHEILCTLEDILKATKYLLKSKGVFTMVHRPQRLNEILSLMKTHSIEPKTIRFVHVNAKLPAILVLIQGLKDMNPSLTVEPPLIIHKPDGTYTEELNLLYGRN